MLCDYQLGVSVLTPLKSLDCGSQKSDIFSNDFALTLHISYENEVACMSLWSHISNFDSYNLLIKKTLIFIQYP